MSNGEIRHWLPEASATGKVRATAKPVVASVDEVRVLRPAYNEMIVSSRLGTQSDIQYRVHATCSLFGDPREHAEWRFSP